jgi:hypothetical protein
VGPTRTVPPDHQTTPRTAHTARTAPRVVDDSLELNQPPTIPLEPAAPPDWLRYRAAPPDETRDRLDAATDLTEPVPHPYHSKVIADRLQPSQEPLGRRTPEPLDASREGIER